MLVLLALSTIGSTVLTGFATLATQGWPAKVVLLVGSFVLNFGLILAAFMIMIAAPLRWRELALGAGPGDPLLANPAGHWQLVCRPRA